MARPADTNCPPFNPLGAAPFDPKVNEADAMAVLSDEAPAEFWYDYAEAPGLIAKVRLVKDFLGCNLVTAKRVMERIEAAQRR